MRAIEEREGRPIEELLTDLYVTRGLNMRDAAAELGIDKGAFSRWLERFGIPARRKVA